MTVGVHRFVFGDVAERVDVGPDMALVVFAAETFAPEHVGFEHICGRWPDDREPDGEFVKVVAPRLSRHTVTRDDAGVITVEPSILCPDCGLHGYVRAGVWSTA